MWDTCHSMAWQAGHRSAPGIWTSGPWAAEAECASSSAVPPCWALTHEIFSPKLQAFITKHYGYRTRSKINYASIFQLTVILISKAALNLKCYGCRAGRKINYTLIFNVKCFVKWEKPYPMSRGSWRVWPCDPVVLILTPKGDRLSKRESNQLSGKGRRNFPTKTWVGAQFWNTGMKWNLICDVDAMFIFLLVLIILNYLSVIQLCYLVHAEIISLRKSVRWRQERRGVTIALYLP